MPVYSTRPDVMGMAAATAGPATEKTVASTVMTTSSHLAKCVEMAEQIVPDERERGSFADGELRRQYDRRDAGPRSRPRQPARIHRFPRRKLKPSGGLKCSDSLLLSRPWV